MKPRKIKETEQEVRVEKAVLIQALWAERAGVNGDVYNSSPTDSVSNDPESLRLLIRSKLEEWTELVVAMLDAKTNQANRLLELADFQAYSYNYVGHVWKKESGIQPSFSLDEAKEANQAAAQQLLVSKVYPFPEEQLTSEDELEKILDYLTQLGIEHLAQHFEFVGFHPNGSVLAEVKMAQLEDGIKRAVSSIHEAVMYGRASKSFLKTTVERILSSTQNLPHLIRKDATLEMLMPMFDSLDEASRRLFAYGTLHELVESIYVRDVVIHPETQEQVLVAGKNARNYPPLESLPHGWTLKDVRQVRNYFPDSILPPDFVLGKETPEEYLKRKTPQGAAEEVRNFKKDDIR